MGSCHISMSACSNSTSIVQEYMLYNSINIISIKGHGDNFQKVRPYLHSDEKVDLSFKG